MTRLTRTLAALLLVAAATLSARAAAQPYTLDRSHSDVGFTISHMMISKVRGAFRDFNVDLNIDTEDVSKSSVKAVIQVASIDTDNADRDKHLLNEDFFEEPKFKTITFTSKKIEKRGNQWVAIGDFTMKGVTKSIELPFTLNGPIQDPWGNSRVGIETNLVINRRDYGISYGTAAMVGDEVSIQISLEATQKK
jgi:polyisoprenoid-binding protein YceI